MRMSVLHVLILVIFNPTSAAHLRVWRGGSSTATGQDLIKENSELRSQLHDLTRRFNATTVAEQAYDKELQNRLQQYDTQNVELKGELLRLEKAQVASAIDENELKIRLQRDEQQNDQLRAQFSQLVQIDQNQNALQSQQLNELIAKVGSMKQTQQAAVKKERVSAVIVFQGTLVDMIKFEYEDGSQQTFGPEKHGGVTETRWALPRDEYLVKIEAKMGDSLDGCRFFSSSGLASPWYGGTGGESTKVFQANADSQITGLTMRNGGITELIDGIMQVPITKLKVAKILDNRVDAPTEEKQVASALQLGGTNPSVHADSSDPTAESTEIDKIEGVTKNVSGHSEDVGAIILEPRCHIALPLTVWNMRKKLPSLPIQMFYAESNAECVKEWFGHMKNMTLTKLGSEFWLNSHSEEDFSWIFTNPQFWKKVKHEKVLSFQQDSWICGGNAEAKLKGFLRYDYVGAPWGRFQVQGCPGGVGNGGFSLRNVKVMEAISAQFGQTTVNEDMYFCRHLNGWQPVSAIQALGGIEDGDVMLPQEVYMPDRYTAGEFSAEEFDGSVDHAPLAMHKAYTWPWYNTAAGKNFQKNCPGLHLLAHANKMDRRFEADHKEAVKQGKNLLNLAAKLDAKGEEYDDSKETNAQNSHAAHSFLQIGATSNALFAVTIKREKEMPQLVVQESQIIKQRLRTIVAPTAFVGAALGLIWSYTYRSQKAASGAATHFALQGSSIAASEPDGGTIYKAMKCAVIGSLHIIFSAAMILLNKYLMSPTRFPHAVALTTMHMAFAFVFTRILFVTCPALFASSNQIGRKSEESHGAMDLNQFWQFLPIGGCAAGAIVAGNVAYMFSSVSFLQMQKEAVLIMVYLLTVFWGMEVFRTRNFLVLTCVMICAATAVSGDLHFAWAGLVFQFLSSMMQAAQAVLTNSMYTRTGGAKIDPLTMVLRTAPVVLIVLLPFNCFFWSPVIWQRFIMFKSELLLSGILAFSLQVVNAVTIYVISAQGLALAGVVKDLMIVVSAVVVLHESLTKVQVVAFAGAIIGIATYSSMKAFPSWFERPASFAEKTPH